MKSGSTRLGWRLTCLRCLRAPAWRPQIEYGLLTDPLGRPVVRVFVELEVEKARCIGSGYFLVRRFTEIELVEELKAVLVIPPADIRSNDKPVGTHEFN